MLEKILDKYYRKKIAKEFMHGAKMIFYLDFYYVEYKDRIEIYANYSDERKTLAKPRKITTISNESIIYVLANFNEAFKKFKAKVDEIMN